MIAFMQGMFRGVTGWLFCFFIAAIWSVLGFVMSGMMLSFFLDDRDWVYFAFSVIVLAAALKLAWLAAFAMRKHFKGGSR